MNKVEEYFVALQEYFKENPDLFGIIMVVVGLVFIVGAIRNWNWLFGDVSGATHSLKKLDGIINMFGRKVGRIYTGIAGGILIVMGIVWFILYRYYV